jgi:sporulation protein YlmC with PRC-barrel domain
LSAVFAAGLLAAVTGWCADPAATASPPAEKSAGYPVQRMSYLTRASDLVDMEVTDLTGHKLGKLEDFVVDWNRGRVYCALVVPEHLYGASNYYVAVPAGCFLSADISGAVVNTNLTTLIGVPRFIHTNWDMAGVSASMAAAYRRFDQPVFWDETNGLAGLGEYRTLLGREVDTPGKVDIGKLADLVLDLPAERVMLGVVSFYGSEDNLHAVPLSALAVAPDKQNFVLNVADAKVGGLVNHDGYLDVEFTDPDWVTDTYRDYGKEPGLDSGKTGAN